LLERRDAIAILNRLKRDLDRPALPGLFVLDDNIHYIADLVEVHYLVKVV
jgi:hypothetical protein